MRPTDGSIGGLYPLSESLMDRLYCTLAEVLGDLELNGVKSEKKLMDFIRAASLVIDNRGGWFIPTTEARRFAGNGQADLWGDPLLAITRSEEHTSELQSQSKLGCRLLP